MAPTPAADNAIVNECRRVYAHEGNESAEVEKFYGELIAQRQRSTQSQRAAEQNVILGYSPQRESCEETLGNDVVPPHSIQEPSRCELRASARTHCRYEKRQANESEQERTARPARNVDEPSIHIRIVLVLRPDQLARVNFKRG